MEPTAQFFYNPNPVNARTDRLNSVYTEAKARATKRVHSTLTETNSELARVCSRVEFAWEANPELEAFCFSLRFGLKKHGRRPSAGHSNPGTFEQRRGHLTASHYSEAS